MMNVYFPGNNFRQRRRETVLHPPAGVVYVTDVPITDMAADYLISKGGGNKHLSYKRKLVEKIIAFIAWPNLRWIKRKKLQDINLVHTPGFIPLNPIKYVVEVDNPLCLARYDLKIFLKRKKLIEKLLLKENCRSIICISEAAKQSMASYFSQAVVDKCVVVYPFVEKNIHKKSSNLDKVVILTCNTKFYMKGTSAILEAYEKLRQRFSNLELWVVSNTPAEYLAKYKDFADIKFFKAEYYKDELYKKFYSQCDIFVQASLQDSFGLVYLELLASGKPIVTTDLYAIPEIVKDGYNGILIKAPFYMYNSDYTLKPEYFPIPVANTEEGFYKKIPMQNMVNDLCFALDRLVVDKNLRAKMEDHAARLLEEKFSEQERVARLSAAYGLN